MFGNNGLSLADVAAVTNGNNGFGGENGWWILIILFAIFGWGNGGWNNGTAPATASGVTDGYILTTDFATLERKMDGINNGICSLGYDQLAQMNGINQNVSQTGYNILNAINADTVAGMQNQNAIQAQLADCCCQNREAIAGVNFNLANASRDIIENQNANTRAVLDALCQQQIAAKDQKIADQAAQINALQLTASQVAQNNYLIAHLQPTPVPAYPATNLYGYMGQGCGGCGCA